MLEEKEGNEESIEESIEEELEDDIDDFSLLKAVMSFLIVMFFLLSFIGLLIMGFLMLKVVEVDAAMALTGQIKLVTGF